MRPLTALLALTLAMATLLPSPSNASISKDHVVKFKRQNIATSKYPAPLVSPPQSSLPQEWIDALNALQNAGKIPNIPTTTINAAGIVQYPKGWAKKKSTCSWSVTNCQGPNDIHEGAPGIWTISFDDGPTEVSTGLYDYLHSHNQAGTHFMIGSQILAFQDAAKHALATQQQLAVHTWSHTLQTTKTNMEILGELGWTMQIIYDLSGRVPKYWRPPQGDIDNRVRAIAEGVFNLTAVMWNAECNDWCIQANGTSACPGEKPGLSQQSVQSAIQKALKQPKNPGVMLLEHELNKYTVGFFEDYYPTLQQKGWKALSVPEQFNVDWYHNAATNDDTPINVTSMVWSDVQQAVSRINGTKNTAALKSSAGGNGTAQQSANTSDGTNVIVSLATFVLASTLASLMCML